MHAPFFHGRWRETEELLSLVEHQALTVVYGKSGLGKTSLLRAGVFPRLRGAGLVPIRVRLAFGLDEHGGALPPLVAQVRARLREAIEVVILRERPPETTRRGGRTSTGPASGTPRAVLSPRCS